MSTTFGLTPHMQYAAVMGLPKQLQLQGNDFSNAATAFFIAYLIAEIPNGAQLPADEVLRGH